MISLLAKIFIKDSGNYKDSKVRTAYGILCGAYGIFWNILLFVSKIFCGILAGSVAIIADAFNNLSDAASSIVQIVGFKLASKKPDPEHPFGHGRLEYISGLIISFLILLMGVELIKSSVKTLVHPEAVVFQPITLVILIFSILVKFYMFLYNRKVAKKIESVSMDAIAKDSLSDTISTFVVIISVIASKFTAFPVDGIGGIIVGFFILKTGYEAAKETIEPLLGMAPAKEFVDAVEKEVLAHKPIVGIHDLVVHDYGPGRLMVSLHAEIPGNMNVFDMHEVIDVTEVDVSRKLGCHCVIHMDPIDSNNKKLAEYKQLVKSIIKEINPEITCHDLRMVSENSHTKLIFDVVKPFDCKLSDEELEQKIIDKVNSHCQNVCCVITVDVPFVQK